MLASDDKTLVEKGSVKDPMMVGYLFPWKTHENKTPYDFCVDESGMRPGERTKPSGMAKTDLDRGIKDVNIPPLKIWRKGLWAYELDDQELEALCGTNRLLSSEDWYAWIVPGEGTPGNYLVRVFLLPHSIAQLENPLHPMMWPENLKFPPPRPGGGWIGTGFGTPSTPPRPIAPATPAPPAPPPLPQNVRFRCPGCGHWFKEGQLAGHKTHCCPGSENWNFQEQGSDFAILCECCLTLDEVSVCKPGFPRAKKEEVKPDEEKSSVEA